MLPSVLGATLLASLFGSTASAYQTQVSRTLGITQLGPVLLATEGYVQAHGEPNTATYNGRNYSGTYYSKPLDRADLPKRQGSLLDGRFVAHNPFDVFHSSWKPMIDLSVDSPGHDVKVYGANFHLGTKDHPFEAFSEEQLGDKTFLEEHRKDSWQGTAHMLPYADCPEGVNPAKGSFCVVEMSQAEYGMLKSVQPATRTLSSLSAFEAAMLHRDFFWSQSWAATEKTNGELELSDPQQVIINKYQVATNPETGTEDVVVNVFLMKAVGNTEDESASHMEMK